MHRKAVMNKRRAASQAPPGVQGGKTAKGTVTWCGPRTG